MTANPLYVVPPGFQLGPGSGSTGPYDCTAWSASRAIGHATGGASVPTGRTIRLQSNEPVPDPKSPGLNLGQVAAVAHDDYHVYLEQHVGGNALSWADYEQARKSGRGAVIQLQYAPIANSRYDAGRGFRLGHAMFESQHATYDPLADGRARGVWRWDGTVYSRNLIRQAAGDLIIGYDSKGHPIRVGEGRVWCALTRDDIPDYRASIQPAKGKHWRGFRVFKISGGRIVGYEIKRTRSLTEPCSVPRAFAWPGQDNRLRYLVQLKGGRLSGAWVHSHWSSPQ